MTQTQTRVWRIRLPYVKPPLSLNARQHWAARARETRRVRSDVRLLVRAAKVPELGRVRVQLEYTPRDARRRDTDNLVATLKAVCDGVVDAGVVPDDTPEFMGKPEPLITAPDRGDPHLRLVLEEVL